MPIGRSKRCTLLSLVFLASLGCYRTPMQDSTARTPSIRHDASPDLPSRDLATDFGLGSVAPDSGTDLASDVGADLRELGPDLLPGPDLPRDLGTDVRDLGLESSRDLGTELRDLGGDPLPDVPPDLSRDVGAELRDLGLDLPRDLGSDTSTDLGADLEYDTAPFFCTPGEDYVLILSGDRYSNGALYRFYPDTLALVYIGGVSCGKFAGDLNSLTVSPLGPAYISTGHGELCVLDLTTFVASPTGFDATAISNRRYGMAVLPDSVPAGQTLYIAITVTGQADTLARVDLSSFGLTTIGPIQLSQDGSTEARSEVELTAGSKGQLYGFSVGDPTSLLLTIDPNTGNAIDVSLVPVGASDVSFALVDWKGTIYLFFADQLTSSGATIFTYHPGDAQVTQVGTIGIPVLGAGVALCH